MRCIHDSGGHFCVTSLHTHKSQGDRPVALLSRFALYLCDDALSHSLPRDCLIPILLDGRYLDWNRFFFLFFLKPENMGRSPLLINQQNPPFLACFRARNYQMNAFKWPQRERGLRFLIPVVYEELLFFRCQKFIALRGKRREKQHTLHLLLLVGTLPV